MSQQAPAQSTADDGKSTRTRSTFRLEYAVRTRIAASPARVWSLLGDGASWPRWNSTIESLEGAIALGQKVKLKVKIAPGRVFNLKVDELVPAERLVWSDGMAPMFRGVRTYTLAPQADGGTEFAMREVFTGVMLPMIAGSLPDFGPEFERFAADLKREAERPAG